MVAMVRKMIFIVRMEHFAFCSAQISGYIALMI